MADATEPKARSRSPVRSAGGTAEIDVAAAHRVREAYTAPKQSKFRVAAVVRFVRKDGTHGTLEAVNAEPHDANIRGAICAERVALCNFQKQEAASGSRITRVVCVTDHTSQIFPGPCCREFLTATCEPDVEIVASGTADQAALTCLPLRELLPLPSVYRQRGQDSIKAIGSTLRDRVKPPLDENLAAAYTAAVACARKQEKQAVVFPVQFAAAVRFANGRVYATAELKGIEYGCTVDAVSLLMPEIIRTRDEDGVAATCIIQADQFGVAHAPFAAARGLLIEHGLADIKISAHDESGSWAAPITVRQAMPHCGYTEMF